MDDPTRTFDQLRPRLQGIAYRMLGSVAEAEEVVQDVWLRWHETDPAALDSAEAWLVTCATRLSIDRLRSAKVRREHYVGIWLPEPILTDSPPTPDQLLERADEISTAFLMLLERLTPEARAAFLLREVFDADYPQVSEMIGKSEAACRQLVHRAKTQLREERPRFAVPAEVHRRLLGDFAAAITDGNLSALRSMLAEGAELIGDGGGKVPSTRRHGSDQRIEIANFNGQWGLLRFIEGKLESAQSFETDGERIVRIQVQRNPDKLARLEALLLH